MPRVTPKQKALTVGAGQEIPERVTLAIDGANDINMIKSGWRAAGPGEAGSRERWAGAPGPTGLHVPPAAADIGIVAGQGGHAGRENSDYVLAQFCFSLRRLLLVHGRWSYMRVCKFLRFLYKTLASMMVQIWPRSTAASLPRCAGGNSSL